jgi:hypothetical protein
MGLLMRSLTPRLLACLIVLLGGIGFGWPVQAQSAITLASVQIDLWPEFDKPSTLVIVDGRLATNVPLPADLVMHIPADAGQPHAVAMRDANGELLNAPFTATPSEEGVAVAFQATVADFRVEYYDPALTIRDSERQYQFQWTPDYPVQAVTVRVQQPSGASALQLPPGFTSEGAGEFGLLYHTASFGALAAGQPLNVNLTYSKASNQLFADALGETTQTSATTAPSASANPSPWVLVGLAGGGLLIAGGVYSYWRARRPMARKRQPRPSHAPRHHAPKPSVASAVAARFCTQCGQAAQANDQFCRKCGAKLRV